MRGTKFMVLMAGVLAASGCQGPGLEAGFDAPDSAAQLHAAAAALRHEDREHIPQLVELLGSDDPAVRMVAITALERMTSERLGYEHWGTEWERRGAVARWRAWLAGPEGRAAVRGGARAGGEGPGAPDTRAAK